MKERHGALVRNLAILLALTACTEMGWTSGSTDGGPNVDIRKIFKVDSTLTTQIRYKGLTITATCESPYTTRWLGLSAADGTIKVPGEPVVAKPFASIQVYGFQVKPKDPQIQEETTFQEGVVVTINSEVKKLTRLLLYVPKHGSNPAHMMIITPDMAGKGKVPGDGFLLIVDKFESLSVVIRFLEWPDGDPIICDI
jgi:hypothetical protein